MNGMFAKYMVLNPIFIKLTKYCYNPFNQHIFYDTSLLPNVFPSMVALEDAWLHRFVWDRI